MKKLIIALLLICLVFTGAMGYAAYKKNAQEAPEAPAVAVEATAEPETAAEPQATAAPVEVPTLDYEALYAAYNGDDVVLRVDNKDMTWDEYFYWLHYYAQQVESFFTSMATNYSQENKWTDFYKDDITFADYVTDGASNAAREIAAIEGLAAENSVTVTEEQQEELVAQLQSDIKNYCGEDGTEEQFFELMMETYLSRAQYDRMNAANYLYQNCFNALYGENGELVDDETALAYLNDNGYMCANHILLMTIDPETGEPLDEAAAAEKKATAEKIAKELAEITDKDALLAKFAELKDEYCDDTGKVQYPDGYTYTAGTMVAAFEDAVLAMEEYQLSEIVETDYGYHIILRLPLSADGVVKYSSGGTPMTGRSMKANEEYGEKMQAYLDSLTVEYAPGFTIPKLEEYVKTSQD